MFASCGLFASSAGKTFFCLSLRGCCLYEFDCVLPCHVFHVGGSWYAVVVLSLLDVCSVSSAQYLDVVPFMYGQCGVLLLLYQFDCTVERYAERVCPFGQ